MSVKMNKKIVLLALASVFMLSAVIGTQLIVAAAAQPREPGVSEGDWALYDVTPSGNATMPPEMNITLVKITVQEISDTNITSEFRVHYANGTEETETYVLDVDTGQGNGTGFFIAKNLYEDDLIYTSPPPSGGPFGISFEGATINETIFRTYLGESVEVNHLNMTTSYTYPGYYTVTMSISYYWYRATGMLAEISIYELIQPVEGPTSWIKMEIVIIDIIPEFPPALILPLFMIATLAAVLLGKTIWSTKKLTRKPSPYA